MIHCCSKHKECTSNNHCVRDNSKDLYKDCMLGKRLSGKVEINNESIISRSDEENPVLTNDFTISISIDNRIRIFSVKGKGFGRYEHLSHNLSGDERDLLCDAISDSGLDFGYDFSKGDCIIEGTYNNPANSRCILSLVDGEKNTFRFHILNFDGRLLCNSTCQYISELLQSIESSYELSCTYEVVGSSSNYSNEHRTASKNNSIGDGAAANKISKTKSSSVYSEQISLFQL